MMFTVQRFTVQLVGSGAAAPASTAGIAVDLVFAVAVWALACWAMCSWLLRRDRAGNGSDQPTVRRTKPRRPSSVNSSSETTSALRYATAGIVSMDGVSEPRSPSLT